MSTASTSLQNTTSSCLNWSSFVLGLLTDSNYNIDAIVWYFQISTKHNKCYLKILFIFFSFCQTELSNYISLTSPLAAPFSLQFARCCIFGRSMLQAQQWKQNCSVISPSLASGISHSTRKLQRHNKLLQSISWKLWLPLISPLKGYKTWCISSTSLFSYITFTRDCRCN